MHKKDTTVEPLLEKLKELRLQQTAIQKEIQETVEEIQESHPPEEPILHATFAYYNETKYQLGEYVYISNQIKYIRGTVQPGDRVGIIRGISLAEYEPPWIYIETFRGHITKRYLKNISKVPKGLLPLVQKKHGRFTR